MILWALVIWFFVSEALAILTVGKIDNLTEEDKLDMASFHAMFLLAPVIIPLVALEYGLAWIVNLFPGFHVGEDDLPF